MSSDPTITTPPRADQSAPPAEQPVVPFSAPRWFFSGIRRLSYRLWTRVAAHLFPEGSRSEHLALAIGLSLPDKLNMSWVTDNLAVGGRVKPQDIRALARAGINSVVDTRLEYHDDPQAMAKEHIALLHLPAPDTYPLTVQQLLEGASWVSQRMQQGSRVLIHCEHGVGRSVLLTCATLVYDGMPALEALQLVQQKRWQASPNHRQIERLREFEAACLARRRA